MNMQHLSFIEKVNHGTPLAMWWVFSKHPKSPAQAAAVCTQRGAQIVVALGPFGGTATDVLFFFVQNAVRCTLVNQCAHNVDLQSLD